MEETCSQLASCGVARPAVLRAARELLNLAEAPEPGTSTETQHSKEPLASDSPASGTATAPASEPPGSEHGVDLSAVVVNVFEELARERHSGTGMVPIHEVRAEVANRCGEQSARHDRFDPVVQRLRRSGRIRLLSITDPRDATPEQLNDSIAGVHETLFYMRSLS